MGSTAGVKLALRACAAAAAAAAVATGAAPSPATVDGCACLAVTVDSNGSMFNGCGPDRWCDVEPGCDSAKDANADLLYDGWDRCNPSEPASPEDTTLRERAGNSAPPAPNRTGAPSRRLRTERRASERVDAPAGQKRTQDTDQEAVVQRRFRGHHRILEAHRHELSGAIRSRSLAIVDEILTAVQEEGGSTGPGLPAQLLTLPNSDPPLIGAVATGATPVVQRLLAYQSAADWLHLGANGDSALMRCADAPTEIADEESLVLTAKAVLAPLGSNSARLLARLPNLAGDTPLVAAVRRGRPALVSVLLSAGADVGATDSSGRGVFHLVPSTVAEGEALAVAEKLLTADADIEAPVSGDGQWHQQGMTALMSAAASGHLEPFSAVGRVRAAQSTNVAMVKALVRAGADIHALDLEGHAPTAKAHRLPPSLRTASGLARLRTELQRDEL